METQLFIATFGWFRNLDRTFFDDCDWLVEQLNIARLPIHKIRFFAVSEGAGAAVI